MKRHYTDADFIQTSMYRDGSGYGCAQGYCAVCGGDMQRFLEKSNQWGPVRHYNSHGNGGVKKSLPPRQSKPRELTPLEKILAS